MESTTDLRRRTTPDDESAAGQGAGPEPAGLEPVGEEPPEPGQQTPVRDLKELADEICSLAASIASATARFLVLLKEYDERGGWKHWQMRSCAHWLAWRCAMSLRTAQEHVRIARALTDLPQTRTEFLAGRLSFSKVRAISRVATSDTEGDLVMLAQHATAGQVENLCRGLRTTARTSNDPEAEDVLAGPSQGPPRPQYGARWHYDSDTGDLIVFGRFNPDDGAVLLAALTRAELERTRVEDGEHAPEGNELKANDPNTDNDTDEPTHDDEHEAAAGPAAKADGAVEAEGAAEAEGQSWESSIGMLRTRTPGNAGPALVAMAMMTLTELPAPAIAPAAEVLYLHHTLPLPRSAERKTSPRGQSEPTQQIGEDESEVRSAERTSAIGQAQEPRTDCAIRVLDGPALAPEITELVTCTAHYRDIVLSAGAILSYGRRRRRASPQQVKALLLRDHSSCQAPGCGRRGFLHAHHVTHWAHGGPTDLDNLLLLCSACHTAVHQGKIAVTALGKQRFEFRLPDTGQIIPPAPPAPGRADQLLDGHDFPPGSLAGNWDGSTLHLSEATGGLLDLWAHRRRQRNTPAPEAATAA